MTDKQLGFLEGFEARISPAQACGVRGGLKLLAWQGILLVGSGTMIFWALNFTMVINATLLNATQPVVTMLFAWMVTGERLRRIQLPGVASALAGVGIMVSKGRWDIHDQRRV
jgi:drug/metabolite transporter (DMT)-like permease